MLTLAYALFRYLVGNFERQRAIVYAIFDAILVWFMAWVAKS